MVQLFDLVSLDVVFQAALVVFSHEVAVCSVEEHQIVDVVW